MGQSVTGTEEMQFEGPLFLVGMPRSGTKLVRNLLNRHPRIGIPEIETEFLPWLARRIAGFSDLSEVAAFRSFYRTVNQQTYFQFRRERGASVAVDDWYAACRTFDAAGIFEALIRLEVGATPGTGHIWGDKSPSYINDLPLLKELFPAARIIHIIRDVRDYCLSIQTAWGKDIPRAAQRWADDVQVARQAGQAFGSDYTEVRYEDLLDNPDMELDRLCRFIGVEFVRSMTYLERPSENLGEARGSTKIVFENHGKYLTQMPRRALARVEAIAGKALEDFGYVLTLPRQDPARLTPTQLRLAQWRDAWNLVWRSPDFRSPLQSLRFHLRYFRTTRG